MCGFFRESLAIEIIQNDYQRSWQHICRWLGGLLAAHPSRAKMAFGSALFAGWERGLLVLHFSRAGIGGFW